MPEDFEFQPGSDEDQDLDTNEQSLEDGASDGSSVPAEVPEIEESGNSGMEAAEPQSDSPGWAQELERAGFQSFSDVDNAVRALVESNRQRDQQIQTYADQLRFYQEREKLSQQVPQYQQAEPVAADPQPESGGDLFSELLNDWQDPAWAQQYIEIDEDGNRVISDRVDDETRKKILDVDKSLRRWQEVLQDPRQFAEAIDRRVEKMIRENFESSYEAKQTEAQESAFLNQFLSNNAHWMYQQDPATGEYLRDPVRNNYVYSEQGREFFQHCDRWFEKGVKGVRDQIELASMAMGGIGTQQGSAGPSHQDVAQQQRNKMQGRVNTARSRQRAFNGVTPSSGGDEAGTEQLSWEELTLAELRSGAQ